MTEAVAQPKSWKEKRKRRLIVTSASQHEEFNLCHRKWWLGNVRGLDESKRTSQVFGTVMHGVCERFLRADDRGCDRRTGQPVDLYPPGWEIAADKFRGGIEGVCTPLEQDMIRRLVSSAIENGVLERLPGRRIEHDFRSTVIQLGCPVCTGEGINKGGEKCEACGGDGKGTHVQIVGFIDQITPDSITDHKSTKSLRWAKSANPESPNYLGDNRQILIYAKMLVEEHRANGFQPPNEITLRHNVFCKDPAKPTVRKVEVTVGLAAIEAAWAQVVNNSVEMDAIRRMVETWHQIPDPPTGYKACNAYGGCSYASICTGQESEEGYEKRVAGYQTNRYSQVTVNGSSQPEGTTMSQFDTMMAQKRGAAATVGAMPGAVNPPAPPPPQPPQGPPPGMPPPQGQYAAPPIQQAPAQVYGPPAPQAAPQPQYPPQYPPQPLPQGAAPPVSYPPAQPQVPAAPQPQAQGQPVAPPWSVQGCTACGGYGFNTVGSPCRICDAQAQAAGRPTSANYNLVPLGNGLIQWTARDGSHMGISMLVPNTKPVAVEQRTSYAGPAPAAAGVPAVAQAHVPLPQSPQQPAVNDPNGEEEEKGGRGRPAKSFVLLINCGPIRGVETRGDRKLIDLYRVLEKLGQEIAAQSGVASFWELDAFKRRDMIARIAPLAAKDWGTQLVMAVGVGTGASDIKALVDAVSPLAGLVIVGTAT